MFKLPLYAYELVSLIVHGYLLCLYSSKYKPDHWLMERKPETALQHIMFMFVMTFFHSLSMVAGHELFHGKETCDKVIGTIPYVQSMYSFFFDEHLKGHHKHIGTEEDPACARLGDNAYGHMLRSSLGSIKMCWQREMEALVKEHGGEDLGIL